MRLPPKSILQLSCLYAWWIEADTQLSHRISEPEPRAIMFNGKCAILHRVLPGQRSVAAEWDKFISQKLVASQYAKIALHVDDLLASGNEHWRREKLIEALKSDLTLKVGDLSVSQAAFLCKTCGGECESQVRKECWKSFKMRQVGSTGRHHCRANALCRMCYFLMAHSFKDLCNRSWYEFAGFLRSCEQQCRP